MKRFGLCSDHAGFALKEEVKKILTDQGIEYQDFGTYSEERADYPDFAHKLGEAIGTKRLRHWVEHTIMPMCFRSLLDLFRWMRLRRL